MADFTIGRGDRLPEITATLSGDDNEALDVTGCTVKFILTPVAGGTPTVSAAATVTSASAGQVKYAWDADDTQTAGYYQAEWEVTYSDGRKLTVPNGKKLAVSIVQDLG